jgi:hypothetical protein
LLFFRNPRAVLACLHSRLALDAPNPSLALSRDAKNGHREDFGLIAELRVW